MSVNDYTANVPTPGGKNVAVAGTPERLSATSLRCNAVVITARPGNAGKIAVGYDNAVRATAGAEKGIVLAAGQAVTLAPTVDASEVWIDASTGGDGVSFLTSVL